MILRRLWDHDLAWSFRRSPVTVVAATLTVLWVAGAILAPWIAPQNPFDLAALDLNDAFLPPAYPDNSPSPTPSAIANTNDAMPTPSEMRAPYMIVDNRSRP